MDDDVTKDRRGRDDSFLNIRLSSNIIAAYDQISEEYDGITRTDLARIAPLLFVLVVESWQRKIDISALKVRREDELERRRVKYGEESPELKRYEETWSYDPVKKRIGEGFSEYLREAARKVEESLKEWEKPKVPVFAEDIKVQDPLPKYRIFPKKLSKSLSKGSRKYV
ncbi:MAG: hypothetical protein OXC63_15600 [Aestuariivita sp.]|nr:hypothetical protein [Aestuariivita sp.]MCY4348135.1 hypothetical protein [Aestuariivita sp.]